MNVRNQIENIESSECLAPLEGLFARFEHYRERDTHRHPNLCIKIYVLFKLRGGASRTRRVGLSVGPWKILTNV